VYYRRRRTPLNPERVRVLAEIMGHKADFDLDRLGEFRKSVTPGGLNVKSPPAPLEGHVKVSSAGGMATREAAPSWYKSPQAGVGRCAKAVCNKYRMLCYYECVGVAKRLGDGRTSCNKLPPSLPYEVDADTRDSCAESAGAP